MLTSVVLDISSYLHKAKLLKRQRIGFSGNFLFGSQDKKGVLFVKFDKIYNTRTNFAKFVLFGNPLGFTIQ